MKNEKLELRIFMREREPIQFISHRSSILFPQEENVDYVQNDKHLVLF